MELGRLVGDGELNSQRKYTTCVVAKLLVYSKSLYKSACLSVSESVCLFVCSQLLRNGKPQRAEILRDESPLGTGVLGLKTSGFV